EAAEERADLGTFDLAPALLHAMDGGARGPEQLADLRLRPSGVLAEAEQLVAELSPGPQGLPHGIPLPARPDAMSVVQFSGWSLRGTAVLYAIFIGRPVAPCRDASDTTTQRSSQDEFCILRVTRLPFAWREMRRTGEGAPTLRQRCEGGTTVGHI